MERLPGNQIYNIGERPYYGSSSTSTDYESQFLGSGVPLVVDVGKKSRVCSKQLTKTA